MALKCVTCGLLFPSRNELDWHIRQEHLQRPLPPIRTSPRRPRLRPRPEGSGMCQQRRSGPSTAIHGSYEPLTVGTERSLRVGALRVRNGTPARPASPDVYRSLATVSRTAESSTACNVCRA